MGLLQSSKSVFIVGIKGVAMAGLARMLSQMGKKVSGSDTLESQITDGILSELRMTSSRGGSAFGGNCELTDSLPPGTDLVIYSAAHGGVESAQVQEAIRRDIPTASQAALIAELIQMFPTSIAICGCHGKTTTSSITALALHELGVKVSWLVGAPYFRGKVQSTGYRVQGTENTFPGGHYEEGSEVFVFEADEYGVCPPADKTPKILLYHPTHIVCTNIDFDHPDIYRDIGHVTATFMEFFTHAKNVYECKSSSLEGNLKGVRNCLMDLGYQKEQINNAFAHFGGVARRLEYHGETNGISFYDDYAHHPAEIRVALGELRRKHPEQRIVVLFQSHTYSRTYALKDAFVEALAGADIALVDRIFPSARESNIGVPPVDLEKLAVEKGHKNIKGFASRDELVEYAKSILKAGDVVVTMGAGDIYKVISNIKTLISQPKADQPLAENNKIKHNFPIGDKFTWKVQTSARYYAQIRSEQELAELVRSAEFKTSQKRYILGGGANTLFAHKIYDGIVIEINTKGVEKIREDEDYEYWRIAAGEDWVDLVKRMVLSENLGGLENLAYIPGKVGSAPIQNIGAYGRAFEDVCESVEYITLPTMERKVCTGEECKFAYRTSRFKEMLQSTNHGFVIWSVVLKLAKPSKHTIEAGYFSNYESLMSELIHLGEARPTIQDIYRAVVKLRKKKLPEVSEVGTNGSLFMNPIVKGSKVSELLKKFPKLQYYPTEKMKYVKSTEYKVQSTGRYKIAAGHIFDEIGWKGKRVGDVGTWKNHALVLCNYGTLDPGDIIRVIQMMQEDFEKATGIRLEPEINIVR